MEEIKGTRVELTKVLEQVMNIANSMKGPAVSKTLTNEPVELGSINNPKNTDIINIKITIPEKFKSDIVNFSRSFSN